MRIFTLLNLDFSEVLRNRLYLINNYRIQFQVACSCSFTKNTIKIFYTLTPDVGATDMKKCRHLRKCHSSAMVTASAVTINFPQHFWNWFCCSRDRVEIFKTILEQCRPILTLFKSPFFQKPFSKSSFFFIDIIYNL